MGRNPRRNKARQTKPDPPCTEPRKTNNAWGIKKAPRGRCTLEGTSPVKRLKLAPKARHAKQEAQRRALPTKEGRGAHNSKRRSSNGYDRARTTKPDVGKHSDPFRQVDRGQHIQNHIARSQNQDLQTATDKTKTTTHEKPARTPTTDRSSPGPLETKPMANTTREIHFHDPDGGHWLELGKLEKGPMAYITHNTRWIHTAEWPKYANLPWEKSDQSMGRTGSNQTA